MQEELRLLNADSAQEKSSRIHSEGKDKQYMFFAFLSLRYSILTSHYFFLPFLLKPTGNNIEQGPGSMSGTVLTQV